MSRQQGNMSSEGDCLRKTPGRKAKPWRLWVTYVSAFNRGPKTYSKGWYRTEREARLAGEQMLRKHPGFYTEFKVELSK